MFRSFKKVLLAVLLVAPAVALAQQTGTVAGTVVDAATGESLPGANVLIEETTLGAAADIDGNFRIIGVPVGTHDITASFVGYEPLTLTGVDVSASFTRTLEFELSTGAELEEVQVVYERPLIERSAIGAPRTVSGDDIQNLPVRGAQNVASLQSGVVEGNAGGLNVRGGRSEEVAYYVDGVRVRGGSGNVATNNAAVAEQEQLIGTIPARYGDVQSGVISINTRSGRSNFFGSLEGYTSEVLDDYGWNLAALSIGGPIVPGKVGFFLSGEGTWRADDSPYGISHFQLSDEMFNFVQNHPQSLRFENENGDVTYVPVPMDAFDNEPLRQGGEPGTISRDAIVAEMFERGLIPPDFIGEDGEGNADPAAFAGTELVNTPETLTMDDGFSEARGKDDPSTNYNISGNINFDILPELNLRVGGAYETDDDRLFNYDRSFFSRRFIDDKRDYFRVNGTLRHRVADNAFYEISGDFQNSEFSRLPEGTGSVAGLFNYANIGRDYWTTAKRYLDAPFEVEDEEGHVDVLFPRTNTQSSQITTFTAFPGTFELAGSGASNVVLQQQKLQTLGFSGRATVQLGAHQLEFGGEYQQRTDRVWHMSTANAGALARYRRGSGNVPSGHDDGYEAYANIPDDVFFDRVTRYYGYDIHGLNEVNDENLEAYFDGTSTNVAPHKPFYYGGYVSNRVEFNDLILDVGLRVDGFNTNSKVLRDLWANRPIVRAADARQAGANVPGSVADDWGVFYAGGNVDGQLVGYRDLEGNMYNADGEQVSIGTIRNLGGNHAVDDTKSITDIFKDSETEFTFMPRLGVSFPVTDRSLFFASYNVTSQRPTENSFEPFYRYARATNSSRISNSTLQPEKTTQYELGFRQRLGERAALTISGFYRSQRNKITLRNLDLAVTSFGTYLNRDFTTTQGAELGFQLRRTNNLAIDANYTLSFAKGSGSDAGAFANIAWRGNTFPNFVSPADFDQRHTANLTVDYRYGAGEGPVISGARPFQNMGLNVITRFGSGQKYTPLESCGNFHVIDSFTCATQGEINSATLPSTFQLDLKLDRNFDLGFGESSLKVYLWVQNLLDTRNVFAVYRETGVSDFQGFLSGRRGQLTLASQQFPESTAFLYNAWVAGPVNAGGNQTSTGAFYGSPRQIRLGVLFNF